MVALILLATVLLRRRKASEAERPYYPCLTFYLGQQEVAEDRARAREKVGANLTSAPPG